MNWTFKNRCVNAFSVVLYLLYLIFSQNEDRNRVDTHENSNGNSRQRRSSELLASAVALNVSLGHDLHNLNVNLLRSCWQTREQKWGYLSWLSYLLKGSIIISQIINTPDWIFLSHTKSIVSSSSKCFTNLRKSVFLILVLWQILAKRKKIGESRYLTNIQSVQKYQNGVIFLNHCRLSNKSYHIIPYNLLLETTINFSSPYGDGPKGVRRKS